MPQFTHISNRCYGVSARAQSGWKHDVSIAEPYDLENDVFRFIFGGSSLIGFETSGRIVDSTT